MAANHRRLVAWVAWTAGCLCASALFSGCEPQRDSTYYVQLVNPEPGESVGLTPTLTWRIEDYTPGETYHVLVRADVAENPLDEYYGHEFDTGWHSGQMQHATIVLPKERYGNAKVWWAVRVWDSHGTEYVCRDRTWWFYAIEGHHGGGSGSGCTTCNP
jgi:hypothetical protein